MQTENIPAKRTYTTGPNSKRQKIIRYFKENPEASPAVVARKFVYSPGATHQCKKLALAAMSVTRPDDTFKNGTGWIEGLATALSAKPNGASQYAEEALAQGWSTKEAATPPPSLFSWTDYSLWMDREQMRGYLRGRAVEYLTKGDKLSVEEALRCVTKLSELTD